MTKIKKIDWKDMDSVMGTVDKLISAFNAHLEEHKVKWKGEFAPNGGHDPNNPFPLKPNKIDWEHLEEKVARFIIMADNSNFTYRKRANKIISLLKKEVEK